MIGSLGRVTTALQRQADYGVRTNRTMSDESIEHNQQITLHNASAS
jgi:hypothetical protein